MINNVPCRMSYKSSKEADSKIVYVYDFMHDPYETLQSFALCWCPWNNSWLTVNVAMLTPLNVPETKILNEDKN